MQSQATQVNKLASHLRSNQEKPIQNTSMLPDVIISTEAGKDVTISANDIRLYICPEANQKEIKLFMELCRSQNLNPFINEAYLIKYGRDSHAQLVVGKDVFLKRANTHPDYEGFEAGVILKVSEGKLEYREGSFYMKNESLVGGWAKVYRTDKKPLHITVGLDEYIGKKKDGTITNQWKSKPGTMIRKVATAQGHREAYPKSFAGMYIEEEMGKNETIPDDNSEPINVTPTESDGLMSRLKEKEEAKPVEAAPIKAVPKVEVVTPTETEVDYHDYKIQNGPYAGKKIDEITDQDYLKHLITANNVPEKLKELCRTRKQVLVADLLDTLPLKSTLQKPSSTVNVPA